MDSPFSQIMNSLPRSKGSFDMILIVRLAAAALLLAAALLVEMVPVFKIVLMILSVIASGYDVLLDLIDDVTIGRYFSAPVLLLLIVVLAFVIGCGWEGALLMIIYQLGRCLIDYCVRRTKRSAQELLNRRDPELTAKASVLIEDEHAGDTKLEKELQGAMFFILKCLAALALVFAVAMPLLTSLSVRESIHRALIILTLAIPVSALAAMPLSGIMGMSFATHFGVLFNNSLVLEKLQQIKTAVIDKNGVFADNNPEFIGVKSDVLDERTFMEFVAHAVYYSDQPFAKAILAGDDREFRLDLISDFRDIPGSGVDVKIGGTSVTLAKRELLTERGEAVPYEGKEDSSVYYLMVSGKYIGKVLLSDKVNKDNENLIPALKDAGIETCILLTEDGKEESERLGMDLDADEVYSEFSEETKLQYLETLDRSKTMYIYANSLQTHSSAALDVRVSNKGKYADALVIPEALTLFPESLSISRRVRQIALENALFVVTVKAIALFLGLTGNCTVWFAIFLELAAVLASILNTVRVTKNPLFELPKL